MSEMSANEALDALYRKGEEAGTLDLSEIASAVEELELEPGGLEAIYAEAERRGIDAEDDVSSKEEREGQLLA